MAKCLIVRTNAVSRQLSPVSNVIKGWQEALTKMKPGAIWEIYIPAKLAYGTRGAPGLIGPNETLIFKVNLIAVKKHK